MQQSLLGGSLTFTRYSGRPELDSHSLHFFSVGVCFGGEDGGCFACDARD
jgi:hypothetical protein